MAAEPCLPSQNIPHLTTIEIAEAQREDQELKVYFKKKAQKPKEDVGFHLIEDTNAQYKNGKLIIPAQSVEITITFKTPVDHVLKRQCPDP